MGWLDRIRSAAPSWLPGAKPQDPEHAAKAGPDGTAGAQTAQGGPQAPRRNWLVALGAVFGVWGRLRLWAKIVLPLVFLAFVLLPLLSIFFSTVDDRLDVGVAERSLKPGQSRTLAIMSRLIRREVENYGWVANDTPFWPTYWLDDMPHYQTGIIAALAGFSDPLRKRLTLGAAGAADESLANAASALASDGASWALTANPETQYLGAAGQFESFNAKLAAGSATFDRRSAALKEGLTAIGEDLAKAPLELEAYVRANAGFPGFMDWGCDTPFYRAKGRAYGYRAVLVGLGADFKDAIAQAKLGTEWQDMMSAFDETVRIQPWYVMNGAPDALFAPNHLTALGFHISQSRAKVLDIARRL